SNLERLLYLWCREDETAVQILMRCLAKNGVYRIPPQMVDCIPEVLAAGFADDAAAAETIAGVFREHRYLMDPHTAVAWTVADQQTGALPEGVPNVVLSTASPYKFPQAVLSALGAELPEDPFAMMDVLHGISGVPVPAGLAGLKDKPVRFTDVVDKDALYDYVLAAIAGKE
ncbi:MAG: threonine synthase, partial [Lachnospiraceae bacterium]|nr:threonine synthase [Lachnospiraceae bacterium]